MKSGEKNVLGVVESLKQAGIENAAQEAAWIIKYAKDDIDEIVRRRAGGEPLQYLLGEWEFYGYPFKVGEGVLIPRPETELLVDLAKDFVGTDSLVLDLCAGSGCVGIALTKQTCCDVIAVEKSSKAIKYLKQNIKLNNVGGRVKVIKGDVLFPARYVYSKLGNIAGIIKDNSSFATGYMWPKLRFKKPNCILINPPYLSRTDMQLLQKEVTYEPETALYGGEDGLDFYRGFFDTLDVWCLLLREARLFACEVGDGQAEAVCEMMRKIGLSPRIKQDYNKINRIVYHIGCDAN